MTQGQLLDARAVLAGAPVRVCAQGAPEDAARRGVVLFYHGLGASIDGQTTELHSLARAGLLVVGVDAPGHGARRWPDFDARFEGTRLHEGLVEVLVTALDELPGLLDALQARGWARPGRIGLGGISMGGYLAFAAAASEPRLDVVTPILGSPRWPGEHPRSPHLRPEAFWPTALLSQNAALDANVPAHEARALHETLRPHYRAAPARLAHVEHADCGHFMPAERWRDLWARVVQWHLEHLGAARPGG